MLGERRELDVRDPGLSAALIWKNLASLRRTAETIHDITSCAGDRVGRVGRAH